MTSALSLRSARYRCCGNAVPIAPLSPPSLACFPILSPVLLYLLGLHSHSLLTGLLRSHMGTFLDIYVINQKQLRYQIIGSTSPSVTIRHILYRAASQAVGLVALKSYTKNHRKKKFSMLGHHGCPYGILKIFLNPPMAWSHQCPTTQTLSNLLKGSGMVCTIHSAHHCIFHVVLKLY